MLSKNAHGLMIPLLWRYLLFPYLRVFFLTTICIILLTLVVQLREIASAATLGASWRTLIAFALYQIPYTLPITAIVSTIVSTYLLFKQLSATSELTAMRASGHSLWSIILPFVITATLFASLNFFVISEIRPRGKVQANETEEELGRLNPFALLGNPKLAKRYHFYTDMELIRAGRRAKNVVIAHSPDSSGAFNLLFAKKLTSTKSQEMVAEDFTFIQSSPPTQEAPFGNLAIDNQKTLQAPMKILAQLGFSKSKYRPKTSHLRTSLLLIRIQRAREAYLNAIEQQSPPKEISKRKYYFHRSLEELMRRIAIPFAIIPATLVGISFAITTSRRQSSKSLNFLCTLMATMLICLIIGQRVDVGLFASSILHWGPSLLLLVASYLVLNRTMRGLS